MKNDYLDYMRATDEYKSSDSLMHYRTKGSKNGVSTTPGYKATGEKAKGMLTSAGNHIYNTGKAVATKVAAKTGSSAVAGAKAAYNTAMNTVKKSVFGAVAGAKNVVAAKKASNVADIAEQRRTEAIKANAQLTAAENARKQEDLNTIAAKFKGQTAQGEADKKHAAALNKSLALAKEKAAADEAEYQKKLETNRKQEDMNTIVAKFKGQTAKGESSNKQEDSNKPEENYYDKAKEMANKIGTQKLSKTVSSVAETYHVNPKVLAAAVHTPEYDKYLADAKDESAYTSRFEEVYTRAATLISLGYAFDGNDWKFVGGSSKKSPEEYNRLVNMLKDGYKYRNGKFVK